MQGESSGFGVIGLPNIKTGVWVFVCCHRSVVWWPLIIFAGVAIAFAFLPML